MSNQNNFKNQLARIIKFYKYLRENNKLDYVFPSDNPNMRNSIDFMIRQMENVKDNMSDKDFEEYTKNFGPMLEMAFSQIMELSEDMDINFNLEDENIENEIVRQSNIESESDVRDELNLSEPSEINKEIAEIDAKLKSGELTDEDLNSLLDRRTELNFLLNGRLEE